MKHALILTHYIPRFPASGAPTRDFCLAREMARRHELTFLLPDYGEQSRALAEPLTNFCRVRYFGQGDGREWPITKRLLFSVNRRLPINRSLQVMRRTPDIVQKLEPLFTPLRQALRQIDWEELDLLQIEHSHMAPVMAGVNVPVPAVLDWHNVYSLIEARQVQAAVDRKKRALARHELWRVRRSERQMARRFEMSVAVSKEDATAIRNLWGAASVTVAPNGVDCDYFHNRQPGSIEPNSLVFTGTMDYAPNEEGVLFFCNQVLPLILPKKPEIRLYIVGQRPSQIVLDLAERYPDTVIVTGFVEDVRPYLQRAAVCIVPLLNGGGTRLKILEAMAMRKPVVSTPVGAEGLALVDRRELLIADDPESFAQAVLALLADKAFGRRLSEQGYTVVKQQYDWKQVASRLDEAWLEVTSGS